jgi:hypothetical protein
MQEEQRVYQTNASYLQKATLQPRPAQGNHSATGRRSSDHAAGTEAAKPVVTRNLILRLIQTLKDQ